MVVLNPRQSASLDWKIAQEEATHASDNGNSQRVLLQTGGALGKVLSVSRSKYL